MTQQYYVAGTGLRRSCLVEVVPYADAPIIIAFGGRLEIAAKACIQPDVAEIFFGKNIVDADKRRHLPVIPLLNESGSKVGYIVGA